MRGVIADSRVRGAMLAAGGTIAVLAVTQLILPGGRAGGGTPGAIVFTGLVNGLLNAMLAVGLVLIYRSHRIVNFAQAALGAAGGVFTYNLAALSHWPFFLALVAGLIVATGVAAAAELAFIRRFFDAPRLVLTVITGGMVFVLQGAAGFILALPIFGNLQDRSIEDLGGSGDVGVPFKSFTFKVGSLPLSFGFAHLMAIVLSIAALLALAAFFRFSRVGIAVRAAAENAERARMLGIGIGMLSTTVWAISGLLAGLGVILQGTVQRQFGFFQDPFNALLLPLGAAVVAQMTSFPVAAGAAVGLTVLDEAVHYSFQRSTGVREVGLFVIVLGGLLLQRRRRGRSEEGETSSWQAIQEQRPIPRQMLGVAGIGAWRRVAAVAGLAVVLLVPWVTSARQTNLAGYYVIVAIVLLSLNVLTGWAGQVSWGQFAFVALGAVLGGSMTSRWGIPFWIAIVIVPVVTAGFTMLVGLPALRIRGLFLGIATLAYAYAVHAALFNDRYFKWLLPDRVERPTLFLLDFADERSMYYLVVAGFVVMVLLVSALRRSRPGRVLIAARDNEANVQSFGINVVRTRLTAFGLAGFICGFAGVLLAHHQRAATESMFRATLSLQLFVYAVVGGVGSILGVILAGAYFAAAELVANPILKFVVGPFGLLFLLYAVPGGLASVVNGVRDGALRVIAQRRQIVVPSLFADYDPDALERQLIPLADPSPDTGLASLPIDRRYRRESELYGARGKLATVASRRRRAEDLAAFGAAVDHFADEDGRPAEGQ